MAETIISSRFVEIPCPSGKHQRSIVTFRNHFIAVLFCVSCEHGWTESADHPALQQIPVDIKRTE
jgi:hypothetical protein